MIDYLLSQLLAFFIYTPITWLLAFGAAVLTAVAIAFIYEAVSDYEARRTA